MEHYGVNRGVVTLLEKSRLIIILMVFSMVFVLHGCAGPDRRSEETTREGEIHLQIGSNYLHKGNLEMAHFELTKASRLIPRNPDVHFALGTVHLLRDDIELAVNAFKRTIELDSGYADAYNNLGFAYLKMERWDEAIEASSKALEQVLYETPERALTIMGWAHYKKGDPARAVDFLGRALEIRPHHPDAENKLAMIYLDQGRIDKSKAILVDLVKRIPSFASARLNLGIIYYKERDVLAARKEFRAVLDLVDQKSDEARLAKGYLDLIE
jgi:type IV pilus assembly protein PilF